MTPSDPVRTAAMALIEATEKHDLSVRDDPVVPARAYDALCSALALPVEQPRVAEPVAPNAVSIVEGFFQYHKERKQCDAWMKGFRRPSGAVAMYPDDWAREGWLARARLAAASPSLPDQPKELK